MKSYPKVPRYDHGTVEESIFRADDLILLEKVDGSNMRLVMYDERFDHLYSDQVKEVEPEDGDIVFASKNVVRGTLSDDPNEFDGSFKRVCDELNDAIDREALRELHTEYDTPLLLFGEHMVKHTLDYGYDESPPPAFLGFDVFKVRERDDPPENPFDERFDGFLPLSEAFAVFDRIGLETTEVVEEIDGDLNPESIIVPMSSYGNLQAEGVIIRSDGNDRRIKYRTEEFQERMKTAWGIREDQAESGVELFVARYVTNARIRKHIHKLVQEESPAAIDASTIAEAVVADAWSEEWPEMQEVSIGITPREVYPEAETRTGEVIDTMQKNAKLNDTSLDELWADTVDSSDLSMTTFDVSTTEISDLVDSVTSYEQVETGLAHELISADRIHSTAEQIASENNKEIGRWVISDVHEELLDALWMENLARIANLPIEFVPLGVDNELMEFIIDEIEGREDVEINEKSETWSPSMDDTETDGLGNLF